MNKKTKFDNSVTKEEIKQIDKIIEKSIKKGQIANEKSLMTALS